MDDRGFPNQSNEFDVLIKNLEGGPVLRKRKHPCPDLSVIDPDYHDVFDEAKHGEYLNATLKVDHLTKDQATQLRALIIEYWSVFSPKGQFVPVKDYEFDIAQPPKYLDPSCQGDYELFSSSFLTFVFS